MGFIKKVAVNICIHICWWAIYIIDVWELLTNSNLLNSIFDFMFEYKKFIFVVEVFIAYYIIRKIYNKKPCESLLGKCTYWLLSIIQTLFIGSMIFEW